MNRVPAIEEELELEEIDAADLAPLVSGNSPIVTVPEDVVEEGAAGHHGEADEDEELRYIMEFEERLDAEVQEIRREFGNLGVYSPETNQSQQQAAGRHDEELQDIMESVIRRGIRNLGISTPEITHPQQQATVPQVNVWDVDKAWENEYSQHPDPNITGISERLINQVWNLLHIIQERVNQQTYDSKDIEIADGLNAISVMIHRISDISKSADKVSTGKP